MDTVLFLLFAYTGGKIGLKLKLPAGALLGAMLFIGLLNFTNTVQLTNVSPLLRIAAQIALGTMIGLQFSKEILKLPKNLLVGFTLLGMGSIATSVILALVFYTIGLFPLITGLIAVAPGGIAEMLTLSESVNGNTQAVAIMHLIRFVLIMLLFKWLLTWSHSKMGVNRS